MNGDSRSWSTSSFFKDHRLADERCKNTTLYPYTVVTRFVLTNVQDLLLKCFWREKRFICTRADHCTNEFRICCQNARALLTQVDPSHRSHIIYVIFISTKEKIIILRFIQNAYKDIPLLSSNSHVHIFWRLRLHNTFVVWEWTGKDKS